MIDYADMTEAIRAFIGSTDPRQDQAMTDLAAAYATACKEANDRLRRCVDFIRRGMRTEAIHLADLQPVLLDAVAALDLPEWAKWTQVCASYSMKSPPRLLLEAAQELNEAYAAEQPLAPLLERHRVLALGRAPIRERLAVIQQLAAMDPATVLWEEDLKTFGAARLREIRREAAAAYRSADIDQLARLADEVAAGTWEGGVPNDVKATLRNATGALARRNGVESLRALLPELEAAHGAMAFDEARSLLERWQRIAADSGLDGVGLLPEDIQLLQRVEPVRQWVAREQQRRVSAEQFEAACSALSDAVRRRAPNETLLRLHQEAGAFGEPVPQALEEGVHAVMAARKRAIRVKRVSIAAAVVVVLLLGGIGINRLARDYSEGMEADRWRQGIQAKLDERDPQEAERLWSKLSSDAPKLALRADLRAVQATVEQTLAKVTASRDSFHGHVNAAVGHARQAGALLGLDPTTLPTTGPVGIAGAGGSISAPANPLPPAKEELAQADAELGAAKDSLDTLRNLVRCDDEQVLFASSADQVSGVRRQWQGKVDAAFERRVDALRASVQLDRTGAQAEEWRLEVAHLRAAPDVSPGVVARLDEIDRGLAAAAEVRTAGQREAALRQRQGLALAHLGACQTPDELAAALNQFATDFPSAPQAADFRKAAADATLWASVKAWSTTAEHLRTGHDSAALGADDASAAKEKLAVVDDYLKTWPDSALKDAASAYREGLAAALLTLDGDASVPRAISRLMGRDFMQLNALHLKDGTLYYLVGDGKLREGVPGKLAFDSVVSYDMQTQASLVAISQLTDPKPGPSPQKALAAAVQQQLDARGTPWDLLGLRVARSLIDDPKTDPILRLLLTHEVLMSTASGAGQSYLSGALTDLTDPIDVQAGDKPLAAVAWMKPGDTDADAIRLRCSQIGRDLSERLARADTAIVAARRGNLRAVDLSISATAVVVRESGAWRAITAAPPRGEADVLALSPPSTPVRTLIRVGSVTGGKLQLDAKAMEGVPEGSLVFLCKRTTP